MSRMIDRPDDLAREMKELLRETVLVAKVSGKDNDEVYRSVIAGVVEAARLDGWDEFEIETMAAHTRRDIDAILVEELDASEWKAIIMKIRAEQEAMRK